MSYQAVRIRSSFSGPTTTTTGQGDRRNSSRDTLKNSKESGDLPLNNTSECHVRTRRSRANSIVSTTMAMPHQVMDEPAKNHLEPIKASSLDLSTTSNADHVRMLKHHIDTLKSLVESFENTLNKASTYGSYYYSNSLQLECVRMYIGLEADLDGPGNFHTTL